MEWLGALRGQTVGLDTAPLIYFIERNPTYLDRLRPFFVAAERREFQLVTSLVTLVEVLVHPIRSGRSDLARQYREIPLGSPSLTALPVTVGIAEEAASLRAVHGIRTPDAIQLATAKVGGAKWFLTNDLELPRIPELSVLLLEQLAN